jgi:hypothetical protein
VTIGVPTDAELALWRDLHRQGVLLGDVEQAGMLTAIAARDEEIARLRLVPRYRCFKGHEHEVIDAECEQVAALEARVAQLEAALRDADAALLGKHVEDANLNALVLIRRALETP